jgi:type IV secretory pathway VirB4 component
MNSSHSLNLGCWSRLDGTTGNGPLRLPADHLVTHGVVVGMTGSGKTGLLTVMIEEACARGFRPSSST